MITGDFVSVVTQMVERKRVPIKGHDSVYKVRNVNQNLAIFSCFEVGIVSVNRKKNIDTISQIYKCNA